MWSGMFGSGPGPVGKDRSGVNWGGGRLFQMFVFFFVGGVQSFRATFFLALRGITVGFFFFFLHGYHKRTYSLLTLSFLLFGFLVVADLQYQFEQHLRDLQTSETL